MKKEKNALEALSKEMIKIFGDSPDPSYVLEVAALASVVTAKDYEDIFQALVDGTKHRDHEEYLIALENCYQNHQG